MQQYRCNKYIFFLIIIFKFYNDILENSKMNFKILFYELSKSFINKKQPATV